MPIKLENWETQIEFDIYAMNTREMNRFFQSVREQDWEAIPDALTKVIIKMPKEWGDPKKIDDLLDNIPYPTMRKIMDLFVAEFNTEKNA